MAMLKKVKQKLHLYCNQSFWRFYCKNSNKYLKKFEKFIITYRFLDWDLILKFKTN